MAQTRQQLLALCLGCTDCIGVYGLGDFLYCAPEKGNIMYCGGDYWRRSNYTLSEFKKDSVKKKLNTVEELETWLNQRGWELG